MRVGDAELIDRDDEPALQVRHEGKLVDARTIHEGVAIEEGVARDGAALEAGEQVPAEIRPRLEKAGAGDGGADPRRAEILPQILADAQRRARIGERVDIAGREAGMRREIDSVIRLEGVGRERAPAALIQELDGRLVLELVVPSQRAVDVLDVVNEFLRLLGQRGRSDHAEAQRDLIEQRAGLADQSEGRVQPACIGAIARIGIDPPCVAGRKDRLLNGVFGAHLAPVGKQGEALGEAHRPLRRFRGRRHPAGAHAAGVALVCPGEKVVLDDQREVADVLGLRRLLLGGCGRPGVDRERQGQAKRNAFQKGHGSGLQVGGHALVADTHSHRTGAADTKRTL